MAYWSTYSSIEATDNIGGNTWTQRQADEAEEDSA